MQGSAPSLVGNRKSTYVTFADRSLPPRVRELVEGAFRLLSAELERGLHNTVAEYETQLFSLAEHARSNAAQGRFFEALKEMRAHGAEIIPAFMRGVESALATVRDAPELVESVAVNNLNHGTLALVENVDMDERTVLNEIAGRAEMRNSLPLYLLGQRFGVLAAKPGFEADSLPIGPAALCKIMSRAASCVELSTELRQLLFRQFDKQVIQFVGPLLETVNSWLATQGVLPHITFVPIRARPQSQGKVAGTAEHEDDEHDEFDQSGENDGAQTAHAADQAHHRESGRAPAMAPSAPATAAAGTASATSAESGARPAPRTRWPGMPSLPPAVAAPTASSEQQDSLAFETLRTLLSGRRSLVGKLAGRGAAQPEPSVVAKPQDVQTVLDRLQHLSSAPAMREGKPVTRTIAHLKQDLLMQLRTGQADGGAVALQPEDNDSIELVGMLLDHLMRDLRPASPAAGLLTKLQIPLLRVALADKGFFTQAEHPARQLLNTVAETADWFNSDDAQDKAMLERMRLVVDKVVSDYSGDNSLFENLIGDVNQHLQVQVKRAEVAEKRHVEAARGKEKLELARVQAAETIDQLLTKREVPKFTSNLMTQSWSDVLALSMLRHGRESDEVQHQVDLAKRLVDLAEQRAKAEPASRAPLDESAKALRGEVEHGLLQVGYHADDAQAVATRLVAGTDQAEADSATRTELTARLKHRTRFGQDTEVRGKEGVAELSTAERAEYEQLKRLPFGSWFEFTEADGQVSRRRMSWYSPMTGHSLFVNHRGHRLGEYSLVFLAKEIVAGRVKLLADGSTSLVDRAWKAIVGALRSFSSKDKPAEASA